jgi:hypothetical protein
MQNVQTYTILEDLFYVLLFLQELLCKDAELLILFKKL